MIRRSLLLAALCISQIGGSALIAVAAELISAGSHHGDEVSAKTGQIWFGLYRTEKGCQLKATKIRVNVVNDPVVDAPTAKTGKEVILEQPGETMFLVRGEPGLKSGAVTTPYMMDSSEKSLQPGETLALKLGSQKYTLSVTGRLSDDHQGAGMASYKVVLSDGVRSQIIADEKECHDVHPRLIWAGDVDRDGRLDLLIDASSHYNVSVLKLWLSKGAGARQLVRPAAKFQTTGC